MNLRDATPEQIETVRAKMTEKERTEFDACFALPPEPVTLADLKIRTKEKTLVQLVPNFVQQKYLNMLAETYPGFDPVTGIGLHGVREDVLKARQQGMSTIWLALYFIDTINNPLTETHIYAHDGETTEKLFQVVHLFWEELPEGKKRAKKYSSKKEIVFADNRSGVYVGMVGGKAMGRGGTVNNVHLSERAWSDNYKALETGLFEAVPPDGNMTRETTANSFNEYHEERELTNRGKTNFIPRFFGWNLNPEYRRPVPPNFTPDAKESALMAQYGLDAAQIMFRREKVKNLKEAFPQEYPLTEREAFLSTGNPVFDRACLELMEMRLASVEAVPLPRFRREGLTFSRLSREFSAKTLTVWQEPQEKLVHLISDDSASGLNDRGDLDFCSSSVWAFGQFSGLKQVAHLYGRWEPHELAWLLFELYSWYPNAMIAPLAINHGQSVINTLTNACGIPVNRGNGWGGLYCHNPSDITEKATDTKPEQRLPGYPENKATKSFMIESAQQYISEDLIEVNSEITVSQLFRYAYLTGGEMGGESGTHDDAVSDMASACAVHRLRGQRAKTLFHGTEQREPRPPKTFMNPALRRR